MGGMSRDKRGQKLCGVWGGDEEAQGRARETRAADGGGPELWRRGTLKDLKSRGSKHISRDGERLYEEPRGQGGGEGRALPHNERAGTLGGPAALAPLLGFIRGGGDILDAKNAEDRSFGGHSFWEAMVKPPIRSGSHSFFLNPQMNDGEKAMPKL